MKRLAATISSLIIAMEVQQLKLTGAQGQGLRFEYSPDSDLLNQEKAIEYFEPKYYNAENRWSLSEEHLQEAATLASLAFEKPVLALAAAQVLYLYAWFTRTGDIVRDNIATAAQLFERSIAFGGCSASITTEQWLGQACDIRFGQSTLLYSWLGQTDHDYARGQAYNNRAQELFKYLKTVPRFVDAAKNWEHPLDLNFNQLRYPDIPSRPFWDTSKVPLAKFLEENFPIFKAELQAIVDAPNDVYELLRRADGSVESLATPGGWDAIRIVRYGHWNDVFCEVAPRTCELLRTRKELVNCPYVNTNYYKLFPNSHLKPHYGNAPRLTAHLSVIAPEPLRSAISVGTQQTLWLEGKAVILDDTYAHAVSSWAKEPRYVLATWFCHPCDENHDSGQVCSECLS